MRGDALILTVYFISFFLFLAWLVWFFLQRRKVNVKFELQRKLMEKFNAIEDLKGFFAEESGKNFLKSLNIDGLAPREKLLSSLTRGIILGFFGAACLVLEVLAPVKKEPVFLIAGILILAISLGYLLSTLAAYKLSKKWGIME